MYPKSFEYYRAKDMEDALSFLQDHEGAKIIAGGQSLIPMMKLRLAGAPILVDISRIDSLRYIREDAESGSIKIGAMTTHSDIQESALIKERLRLLAMTADNVADVQIRDIGTIGGSICHADPSADYFPALLVLNAELVIRSKDKGGRQVPIGEFMSGPFSTVVGSNEILEEIILKPYNGKEAVEKFARRKADFAVVCLAMIMEVKDHLVTDFRLAIGPQEDSSVRLSGIEDAIRNKKFENISLLKKSVEEAVSQEHFDFPSDLHGSTWYREQVAKSMITRMATELFGKIAGN